MSFDASPSWSGFNYQGKVALYYSLKCINEESIEKDFSNYSLMLENNEDFEIIIDNAPISFHQVKAYETCSYSKYSEALLEITLELSKHSDVIGKIHTWKMINPRPNFNDIASSITNDIKEILDEYILSADGTSTLHKAASDATQISKRTSIIRNAFKNKNAAELAQLLSNIYNGQNNAISRLEAYKYDDGNAFCDLSSINDKIKSELSISFTRLNIPVTPDQLEKAFLYFLGVMDQYIIQRHKNKQNSPKIPIHFTEIITVLSKDHVDMSKEYLAYHFKERFAYHIEHYMDDPEEGYIKPNDGTSCNLQEICKFLLGLSPLELWKYYRHFSPQIQLNHQCNIDNALESNSEGIRYVLIKIFHTINYQRFVIKNSKYKFIYRNATPPYQHYLPTTITNTPRLSQIERHITSNPNINEILYEIENLIYDGINHHRFSPLSSMHTEAPIAEDADSRLKRDEPLRFINLIPLSIAKDELS